MLTSSSICVRGENDSGEDYEVWYAKVVDFALNEPAGVDGDEVVLSNPGGTKIIVHWFYAYTDVLASLPKQKKPKELVTLVAALDVNHYMLGTKSDHILLDTVNCKYQTEYMFLELIGPADVAHSWNISALCPHQGLMDESDESMVWYRFKYTQAKVPVIVCGASPSLLLYVTNISQEAERWCHDGCQLNRYWHTDEVMWFCQKCAWWFHFGCCTMVPFLRAFQTLEDLIAVPLIKGGPAGLIGTAPLVFLAAKAIEKLSSGEVELVNWREWLETELRCSVDEFIEGMEGVTEYMDAEIKCPRCS
jgi:hypothetical protein